jgi:small-conductance mechanosensitive channel
MDPEVNPQPDQPEVGAQNEQLDIGPEVEQLEVNPEAEQFYSGAIVRIVRLMPILGALGTAIVLACFGWRIAAGYAVGSLIGYMNFVWLKRVVNALADRVTNTGQQEGGRAVVTRFLVRYALIAVAVYGIFRVSKASVSGMLAGLFLPVAAIACEAAYEVYAALRRGI